MSLTTDICELLGIEYPIIQAGMGPNNTVPLAAAVSNAGALGTVSTAATSAGPETAAEKFSEFIPTMCDLTDRNFAVNVPVGTSTSADLVKRTSDSYIRTALDLREENEAVRDQFRLLVTSGGNPRRWTDEIRQTDLLHFHKVGSVKHARKAEELGVDGVIASGYEMGGHTHDPDNAVHTFVLVPEVANAVDVPVIASGGVRDGRTLLAALAMGASGGLMGTRFIATVENHWSEDYKRAILDADEGEDGVVGDTMGAPLRVFNTEGADKLRTVEKEADDPGEYIEADHLAMRRGQQGDLDDGVVVAGQGGAYLDSIESVEELLETISDDVDQAYEEVSSYMDGE